MSAVKPEVRILADFESLAASAATEFVLRASQAVRTSGRFMVALSGGSTPKKFYELLSDPDREFRAQIPWENIHFFWGDERYVPAEHPENNYRMALHAILCKVPVPISHVHRIETENPSPETVAQKYEQTLLDSFQLAPDQLPRFDLILLGLGPCGHTASLFPGTESLYEVKRLVVAQWVKRFEAFRITLTPPTLNNAAEIMFLVSGEDKASVLQKVLEGDYCPDEYPAQLIVPHDGRLLWLADATAASQLSKYV
jgi:6-phosphogluconolactonase